MVSDFEFYTKFRKSVLSAIAGDADDTSSSDRVSFQMHQFKMIPSEYRELFCNITRGHPTSPIYALLAIGSLGTNVARYSVVRRIGADGAQLERTGMFYNFLAPSRLGKGVALGLVSNIGTHIENIRKEKYSTRLDNLPLVDQQGNNLSRAVLAKRSAISLPKLVFLTGGNGLQTNANAAQNGGCGLIVVAEIKSGKQRYTDAEGTYAPLLHFYDLPVPSTTFR